MIFTGSHAQSVRIERFIALYLNRVSLHASSFSFTSKWRTHNNLTVKSDARAARALTLEWRCHDRVLAVKQIIKFILSRLLMQPARIGNAFHEAAAGRAKAVAWLDLVSSFTQYSFNAPAGVLLVCTQFDESRRIARLV